MVHLVVHLVKEIRLYDLVFLWWMYPVECYTKILRSYVKNPHLITRCGALLVFWSTFTPCTHLSSYLQGTIGKNDPEPPHSSTKDSYVAPNPSWEDTHIDIPDQCKLYIDEENPHLVTIGKVYKLGSTMHHQTLDEDHIRVVVEHI
ncbi:hypothetical protein CR513_02721, partial [Mucuna pruriens]